MNYPLKRACLFCKDQIAVDDEVVLCPSCKEPHHKSCWDSNGACANPACSGQQLKEGQPVPCDNKKFESINHACTKCAAQLGRDHEFCPYCGHKVGAASGSAELPAIKRYNPVFKKKNRKAIIITAAIFAGLAAVALLIFVISQAYPSFDKLLAKGNYEKAYKVAPEDSRGLILYENYAAATSALQQTC